MPISAMFSMLESQHTPYLAVVLGLVAHAYYKRFEPTAIAFLLHSALVQVLFVLGALKSNTNVSCQIRTSVKAEVFYLSTLSASIAIYRLYLNPLRKFPGSKLQALTKWYSFNLANQGVTHHFVMKQHKAQGDFIRVGPNELSIADPNFISVVHGNKSRFPKGPWYQDMVAEPVESLISIRDYDEHKSRRKVWDETFTPKALKVYEARISKILDDLVNRFDSFASTGEIVDLSLWSEYVLVDATGLVAFNLDFHCVRDGQAHFYMEFIHSMLQHVASFAEVSWVKPLLAYMPLNKDQMENIARFKGFSEEKLAERMKSQGSAEIDAFGFLQTAGKRNPAYKLSPQGLGSETRLIISGGSDTTSIAISSAMYWLLLDPAAYLRLQTECREMFSKDQDFDAARLGDWNKAPFLNGCVYEALRLIPSGPNGMQRVVNTPGGVVTPQGLHIPENTKVSIASWTVHHDPRNFEKPWDFIPERWIPDSGFQGVHNPAAFIPFSLGSFSCIGKPLALLEIRLFLYRLVKNFDFELVPGFDKRSYIEDNRAWFGMTKAPLRVKVSVAK